MHSPNWAIAVFVLSIVLIPLGCKKAPARDTKDFIVFTSASSVCLVNAETKETVKLISPQKDPYCFFPFWINETTLSFIFFYFETAVNPVHPLGIYDFETGRIDKRIDKDFPLFILNHASRFDDSSIIFNNFNYEINAFNINSLKVTQIGFIEGIIRNPVHMRVSNDKINIVFASVDSIKFQKLVHLCEDKRMAFQKDYLDDIFIYNLQDSTTAQLTNTMFCDRDPTWSPDDEMIAFSSNRSGNNEIYLIDKNGDNFKQLTDNPAQDTDPEFSPDGKRIAFITDRSGDDQIWIMDIESMEITQLTDLDSEINGPISWSPKK